VSSSITPRPMCSENKRDRGEVSKRERKGDYLRTSRLGRKSHPVQTFPLLPSDGNWGGGWVEGGEETEMRKFKGRDGTAQETLCFGNQKKRRFPGLLEVMRKGAKLRGIVKVSRRR